MLSEVLSALKGLKAELQERLAQQPEYRALLILDRATSQLGDTLSRGDERAPSGLGSPEQADAAAPRSSARAAGPLVVVHDAAIDIARGDLISGGAPPALGEAQSAAPPQGSGAPEAANESAGALPARPATIADFRIAPPRNHAEDPTSANAPANLASADGIADPTAAPTAEEIASAAAAHEPAEEPPGALRTGEFARPPLVAIEDRDPPSASTSLVDGEGADDGASSGSQTISGLAALYASAREFSDAALSDDSAAPAPTAAEEAHAAYADAAPAVEPIDSTHTPSQTESVSGTASPVIQGFAAAYESAEAEGDAAAPIAPVSGLAAALYEATGDAPELESEAFAPAQVPATEAAAETAIEAFNRTLAEAAEVAEAAKLSPALAKAAPTRGFIPVFAAQRLAHSRR